MNTVNSAGKTRTGNTKHANNTAAPRLDTGLDSNNTQVHGLNIAYKNVQTKISGRNSWFCIELCKAWFEYQEQLKHTFEIVYYIRYSE